MLLTKYDEFAKENKFIIIGIFYFPQICLVYTLKHSSEVNAFNYQKTEQAKLKRH